MRIIDRYIVREILIPFFAVIAILAGIFTSFNSARFLSGTVVGSLDFSSIIIFLTLKTLIALEVLIPIALYISVIIGLNRLSKDSEFIVLHSVGVSRNRIILSVLIVAIPVGIVSGIISAYIRPWAYAESYIITAQAEAELNMNQFQQKRFYSSDANQRVIYAQSKDDEHRKMNDIFHYVMKDNFSEIIIAKEVRQSVVSRHEEPEIQLFDGYIYQISHDVTNDTVMKFDKLTYFPENNKVINYKRQAASINQLWVANTSPEIAELQWRLSRPIATILLALMAATFIKASTRLDNSNKIYFTAAVVFAIYYNLSGAAQIWVEHGMIKSFPGVWWLYFLMIVFLTISMINPWQFKQNIFQR
ncbi:MAG: LPS export ABC transporter permease LptF [Nitrosomonas sp.]|nr:LPS export ABC transporter permease LptF [Nitrosomonas sp.]